MEDLQLLVDLHKQSERQGPGGVAETKLAMELAGLDKSQQLRIADIGCGTGAASLVLAKELNAEITAVDFLPEFLELLEQRAQAAGVADQITTLNCSMEKLPFAKEQFDVIWSEGAIYNMGFEAGVAAWKEFLKPDGKLIVSEITWLTDTRPDEIQTYWEKAYPEIDTASAKIKILEEHGYSPEAYFVLSEHCWLDNYYAPVQKHFDKFLEQYEQSEQAKDLVQMEKEEIALYEKYRNFYSYGVYVASKLR